MRLPDLGLLRDHDYRQLFASTTVSQLGFQLTQLALPLVAIIALAASPFQVGLLAALAMLPFLLVGLPAGVWVDRLRRRSVLIAGDLGRAVALVTVPVAWWGGFLTIWQLYAVAVVLGTFMVFFDVAYQSYLPHLVGRDHLVEGNAKLESVRATAMLAGPALAGQLIRLLTAPVALLVDAVAMAASALFVVRIRKREEQRPRRPDAHLLREIGEGLRFVLGHRLLRAIALCTGTANFFLGGAYFTLLILFLERVVDLDPGAIGLVFTLSGAGALVGSLVARRVADRVGQGPALWLAIAVMAPFAALMPLVAAPGWRVWLAAAGGVVVGAGIVVYNVTQVSFRQAVTPDHLLGRMNATMRFVVWGTIPLGALGGGALAEWTGIRPALLLAALGASLAVLPVLLSPLRTMRTLPTGKDQLDITETGASEPAEAPPSGKAS